MTTNDDFDRVARAWLDLMPLEAPDRVIHDVLQAVETAPQVRRPRLGGPTRSTPMTRFLMIAATAAVGIGLLGGAVFFAGTHLGPTPTQAPVSPATAIASPTSSPSAPASTPGVPPELQFTWVGEPRDVPAPGSSTHASLQFGATGICVSGSGHGVGCVSSLLNADASALQLTTPANARGCAEGDVGTYPWSLSPRGTVLTVAAGSDACAARPQSIVGTWYRVGCKNPALGCMGDLEAGTRPTQYINPLLPASDAWESRYGAVTYTVPDGWANSVDYPLGFVLTPASSYAQEGEVGRVDNAVHQIELFPDPVPVVQGAGCEDAPDPSVRRTAAGIAAWVSGLPAIVASPSRPITIDGRSGRWLDLAVAPDAPVTCRDDPGPVVRLLTALRRDTGSSHDAGMLVGEQIRLILLDLDKDHVVAILIDDRSADGVADEARFRALIEAATPIVESFHFQ